MNGSLPTYPLDDYWICPLCQNLIPIYTWCASLYHKDYKIYCFSTIPKFRVISTGIGAKYLLNDGIIEIDFLKEEIYFVGLNFKLNYSNISLAEIINSSSSFWKEIRSIQAFI